MRINRRHFITVFGGAMVALGIRERGPHRVACLRKPDGDVVKKVCDSQELAVAWLEENYRVGDEVMITNVGLDYIWKGDAS